MIRSLPRAPVSLKRPCLISGGMAGKVAVALAFAISGKTSHSNVLWISRNFSILNSIVSVIPSGSVE